MNQTRIISQAKPLAVLLLAQRIAGRDIEQAHLDKKRVESNALRARCGGVRPTQLERHLSLRGAFSQQTVRLSNISEFKVVKQTPNFQGGVSYTRH